MCAVVTVIVIVIVPGLRDENVMYIQEIGATHMPIPVIENGDQFIRILDELEKLQPFGAGNLEPLFIADDISIVSSTIVGKNHRRLVLKSTKSNNDSRILAMHFNTDVTKPYPDHFNHMVFKLQWNHWNNAKSIQIIINDFS